MSLHFDHAIIAVNDLETAVDDYSALGFTVFPGGEHASGTTHNALICFKDGGYLELMAPTGKLPDPNSDATDYRFVIQHGEGLVGFALRSTALEADIAAMRKRGLDVLTPQPGQRTRLDGKLLRWKTTALDSSMCPFFIEDETPRKLRVPDDEMTTTHANGALGVRWMGIVADDFDAELKKYGQILGLNPDGTDQTFHLRSGSVLDDFSISVLNGDSVAHMLAKDLVHHFQDQGFLPFALSLITDDPEPPGMLDRTRTHAARITLATYKASQE